MPRRKHIENGQRFGRWTVISTGEHIRAGVTSKVRGVLCRCDCGTERVVAIANLFTGASVSCGCYKRERTSEVHRVHGTGYEDLRYRTWRYVKDRCFRENRWDWKHYGGRGITMYEPWVHN